MLTRLCDFQARQLHPSRPSRFFTALALAIVVGLNPPGVVGQIQISPLDRQEPVSFQEEVFPILQKNCLACHNEADRQGDLVLETPAAILKGGDTGPAAVPGKGAESLILQLASHAEDPVMPPEGNDVAAENLTSEQLGLLKLWIDQGAQGQAGELTLSPQAWQPLPAGIHPVYALALSADGQFLACGRANQIHLYHVPTGQLLTRLTDESLAGHGVAHRDLVQSLAFNQQGDLLASGGFREVKIWKRPRDVQRQTLVTKAPVLNLAVSPDRQWLATVASDNVIQVWNRATGTVTHQLTGHTAEITDLDFGPFNQSLASASLDGTLRVWSLSEGAEVGRIETSLKPRAITWVQHTDGPSETTADDWRQQVAATYWLISGGDDNKLRVWTPPTQPQLTADTPGPAEGEPAEGEPTAEVPPAEPVDPATAFLVREMTGHSQPITDLTPMPGEKSQILSGSRDGTLRRWNVENGQQLAQLNHGGPIVAIAVSPLGDRFASASENKTAKLWNPNGQQLAELRGDLRAIQERDRSQQEVRAANTRLNVAKQQLASAETDLPKKKEAAQKTDEALATANKEVEAQTQAAAESLIEKNKAEQLAITASLAAKLALEAKAKAEAERDEALRQLEVTRSKVEQIAAAANLAPGNQRLQQLLAKTREEVARLEAQSQELTSKVAEPSQLSQQKTQEANTAAQVAGEQQKPYNDALAALELAESAQNLASQQQVLAAVELKRAEELPGQRQALVTRFELQVSEAQAQQEAATQAAQAAEQPLRSVAFSPTGTTLLTSGDFSHVHAWNAETGTAVAAYAGHEGPVSSVAFLDPATIISGGQDGRLRIWEATPQWTLERTVGNVERPEQLCDRITSLDFDFDSRHLLIATGIPSRSGDLVVIDVASGESLTTIPDAHTDAIYSARFSPDGKRIASAGADKYVRLFDVETGELQRRLEGHTNYVLSVSWQGDGTTLASSAGDETIKIWDADTGDQQRTIANMSKPRTAVKFVGETTTVVSSGGDRRVRLHNSTNGGVLRNFNPWDTWLHCVDMTPDGQIVAAGAADGSIGIWNGSNGQLLQKLEIPSD